VLDASRAVGVAQNLVSPDIKTEFVKKIRAEYVTLRERHLGKQQKIKWLTLSEARHNRQPVDWREYTPPAPRQSGIHVFVDYPLSELVPYIDWTPFFIAWELAGRYPRILKDEVIGKEATKLYNDAQKMLEKIVAEKWIEARGIIGLFPANSIGHDDIEIYTSDKRDGLLMTIHTLRQQTQKPPGQFNYALADFIAPKETGVKDYIGAFAIATGFGIEKRIQQFEKDHDDYNAIMLKALADRLAEAFAERLHYRVRTEFWGYATHEKPDNEALIAEKYQGIRPAPGYPACPDHTEKPLLWKLLDVEKKTGITLTESYAMYPTTAIRYMTTPIERV
jgi:5-methyltetrahydrofolate--homocysteine methyltransferase